MAIGLGRKGTEGRSLKRSLSDEEAKTLEAFRQFCRETNLSDLGLERSIGIVHATLRKIMDGDSVPKAEAIKLLAAFLKDADKIPEPKKGQLHRVFPPGIQIDQNSQQGKCGRHGFRARRPRCQKEKIIGGERDAAQQPHPRPA